jgi:hypothetical protein
LPLDRLYAAVRLDLYIHVCFPPPYTCAERSCQSLTSRCPIICGLL